MRPSRIARKARRAHQLQHAHLPCQGCDLCIASASRHVRIIAARDSHQQLPRKLPKMSLVRNIQLRLDGILFKGTVSISPRHLALEEAAQEAGFQGDPSRLVYWTDGSVLQGIHGGIGIAHIDSFVPAWTELSWRVRGRIPIHTLEIYAIAKALEIAGARFRNIKERRRPMSVVVYSDCIPALDCFRRFQRTLGRLGTYLHGWELIGPGILAATELSDLGISMELRHIPAHAGVEGNLKADRAAKKGARYSVKKGKGLIISCTD